MHNANDAFVRANDQRGSSSLDVDGSSVSTKAFGKGMESDLHYIILDKLVQSTQLQCAHTMYRPCDYSCSW